MQASLDLYSRRPTNLLFKDKTRNGTTLEIDFAILIHKHWCIIHTYHRSTQGLSRVMILIGYTKLRTSFFELWASGLLSSCWVVCSMYVHTNYCTSIHGCEHSDTEIAQVSDHYKDFNGLKPCSNKKTTVQSRYILKPLQPSWPDYVNLQKITDLKGDFFWWKANNHRRFTERRAGKSLDLHQLTTSIIYSEWLIQTYK